MEVACSRGDGSCAAAALTAALHALHLYCVALAAAAAAALRHCRRPARAPTPTAAPRREKTGRLWRWQTVRGASALALGATWACGAAAAGLRGEARARLAAAALAPAAWLAAEWVHAALWARGRRAPLLYLFSYWLLSTVASAAALVRRLDANASVLHIEIYIHLFSFLFSLVLAIIDLVCFGDGMSSPTPKDTKVKKTEIHVSYKHDESYYYSKVFFFWLNTLMCKGYKTFLEKNDLERLPEKEQSSIHCENFEKIYFKNTENSKSDGGKCSLLRCYAEMVWPNFYLGGVLKLLGDAMSVVPAVGLAVVIDHERETTASVPDANEPVTFEEFLNNGYIMTCIITLAAIFQAIISQSSTHLVTVEGIRLKTALQGILFEKCMRMAPSATGPSAAADDDRVPLIDSQSPEGLLTNLVSQDTYNVMSCTWICHYVWTIPLKVIAILYLLYKRLGVSALIGTSTTVLLTIPLQFYIGKRIAHNSKEISTTCDHRISKMTEILQAIHVIKLYVWEDLFKEKILYLREVELKLLQKDSIYWSILTFSTQISTVVIAVITFSTYCLLQDTNDLTAANVFVGLALFNQLSIPLLVLPVTILMIVQAKISTERIRDFLLLPESDNIKEDLYCTNDIHNNNDSEKTQASMDSSESERESNDHDTHLDHPPTNSEDAKILAQYKDVVFSWTAKDTAMLEIDELQIPAGKLIMVVGATGAGKSSLLAAIVGEMYLERGDVNWAGATSTWYAGQPPWLIEGSVRENIVLGGTWDSRRYARVLRAMGLRSDLRLLPEGDNTRLGARGAPLSGGQGVRVCLARALYTRARLLALDEPLGALDAALARQVVARGLLPAARAGRTVLLATNRLELLHYADMVIVMEGGRVSCQGRAGRNKAGALAQWWRSAEAARAAAVRHGAGPPGGTVQERKHLARTLSRAKLHGFIEETSVCGCASPAAGAYLLAEVPARTGGSWRRPKTRAPCRGLQRHLTSPPGRDRGHYRWRQDVRRTMSADAGDEALRREASLLRRLLPTRPHRTFARWTPKPLRRLLPLESRASCDDTKLNGLPQNISNVEAGQKNVVELLIEKDTPPQEQEMAFDYEKASSGAWCEWGRACGASGAVFACAALTAQALAVAADCWLASAARAYRTHNLNNNQVWQYIREYVGWSSGCLLATACAAAACAAAGAAARRVLHERLLHATLHAPLPHHDLTPRGALLHRFSADVHVIDRKLPIAVSRWVQLTLVCGAAALVNVVVAPWTLIAVAPAVIVYLVFQNMYLKNARVLQELEASSAAPCVTQAGEARAGAATVRAGRLRALLRARYRARLDHNHNVLLMLNAANRWLGLAMDLVGAGGVAVSLAAAAAGAGAGAAQGAGLAVAYSLLLPTYLAHLAKCRADLDLYFAAVARVTADARMPQEDYRDECTTPPGWPKNGEIIFENASVGHAPEGQPVLSDVTLHINPGEKVAICGRSGSGKSTLVGACVGLAQVCAGSLRVGGARAEEVPLRALRHRLVVAPQEGALFSCTLRENLDPLGVHTDDQIWRSLGIVGLHDFVAAQPAGLECSVSAGKSGWSAGRMSRASLARAVLRAPLAAALLLDEAAATLDAPAERALLAALANALPQITIITVAHRVWSVLDYDRAVAVGGGCAADCGPPAALLSVPSPRSGPSDPHQNRPVHTNYSLPTSLSTNNGI